MPKYVGRHRRKPTWTPWKTISLGIAVAGIFAIPTYPGPAIKASTAAITPLSTHSPEPLAIPKPPETFPAVPPEREDGGRAELDQWIEDGFPGYIPDPHDGKGLVPPEPKITVVQTICNKPDLPYLTDGTLSVYRTVCALFPEISVFGGYRAGDQDHGTGNAFDAMVYGDYNTGEALASFLIDHFDELNIKYIIWQQRIWQGYGWSDMADRGSPTANHLDHVHVSVN